MEYDFLAEILGAPDQSPDQSPGQASSSDEQIPKRASIIFII
jgi:hypothetical protein